jgi:hypothetical protein
VRVLLGAGAIVLATALTACSDPAHFTTMLDTTGGLGPGDAITHGSAAIGRITGVSPAGAGDSAVALLIDADHTGEVHVDSILILHGAGAAPALELMTTDPSSAAAGDGALLYGASNESQAQMIMASLGPPTIVNRYAQFFSHMAPPSPAPSPAAPGSAILQNQLAELARQTLAAAAIASGSTPATAAQLEQFRRDARSVERQLVAHGRSAEADQLRAEVERMNAAAAAVGTAGGAATPSAPANTLVTPRVAPGR